MYVNGVYIGLKQSHIPEEDSMYKIEAHTNANGNIEDQTTPEFLGDAYGVEYLTLGEAKSKALDLE